MELKTRLLDTQHRHQGLNLTQNAIAVMQRRYSSTRIEGGTLYISDRYLDLHDIVEQLRARASTYAPPISRSRRWKMSSSRLPEGAQGMRFWQLFLRNLKETYRDPLALGSCWPSAALHGHLRRGPGGDSIPSYNIAVLDHDRSATSEAFIAAP
jgi:hypothetical protein